MISLSDLQQICGSTRVAIAENYPYVCATMAGDKIDTPLRMAMFLAQAVHECGGFKYLEEIASGAAYEGRKDLGNLIPGDGVKFKGRGIFQITGRANYMKCSMALLGDLTLLKYPQMLSEPVHAASSAGWYWNMKNLSPLADEADVLKVTKKINGGTNGLADRIMLYKRACTVLGIKS